MCPGLWGSSSSWRRAPCSRSTGDTAQRQLQQVSLPLPPEDPHAGGDGEEGQPLPHHEDVGLGAGPGGAGVSEQVLPLTGASHHHITQVLQPGEAGEPGSQGQHEGGREGWRIFPLQPSTNTAGSALVDQVFLLVVI